MLAWILRTIALLLVLGLAAPQAFAGPRQRGLWLDRRLQTLLEADLPERAAMSRLLAAEVERRVQQEAGATRAALAAGSAEQLDVLVIGGGIHAAVFNATMARLAPGARILTVEGADMLAKVFRGPGPMGRINSPEQGSASANVIPGAPIQLAQLSGDAFPTYELMGHVALFAHFASTSSFVLNTRVARLEQDGAGFRATLSDGVQVLARQVVVAIGLGAPTIKTQDEATRELIRRETARAVPDPDLPTILFFEEAIQAGKRALDANRLPLDTYAGQRVAVVGTGDGGNIFMEFLLGRAPAEAYGHQAPARPPSSMVWLGQNAASYEEFKAATKPRYHASFVDLFDRKNVELVPLHLESIHPAAAEDAARGRYKIVARTGEASRTVFADRVILATGYQNVVQQLFEGLGAARALAPIAGPAEGLPGATALAQQLVTGGRPRPVYVVGPAAGALATPAELELTITKNPVSINVLAPRTAGLARLVAGAVGLADTTRSPGD